METAITFGLAIHTFLLFLALIGVYFGIKERDKDYIIGFGQIALYCIVIITIALLLAEVRGVLTNIIFIP
jgi:hypothetical protein